MQLEFYDRIKTAIEEIWSHADVWPDLLDVLKSAVAFHQWKVTPDEHHPAWWAQLPGMCCKAAGGDFELADSYAAAWLLFYTAANTLDHIEDGDTPDDWWAVSGAPRAINATTALIVSASELLNKTSRTSPGSQKAASEIASAFNRAILRMASGQHQDLTQGGCDLDAYWDIAAAKSGTFFSLACFCGARLATSSLPILENYRSYGHHLGVLIQVLDDLEPYQRPVGAGEQVNSRKILRSLPAIYALSVLPEIERQALIRSLEGEGETPGDFSNAMGLIEKSGSALYVKIALERHRTEGLEAIERARPEGPAGEFLTQLITSLGKTQGG